ncbi:hypothetical protein FD12_GL000839 [Lentilactobacillus rapi DSM 19907 = JCM 15042]|nr:hypothetical protein FD12_GL000839 [Lentilactobacillus rapi DSM 19907 = JCM 15042]
MKNKEGILMKIMRYSFSIRGVLDEHNLQVVNRIATNGFMYLWIYTAVANIVMLFLPEAMITHSFTIGFVFINILVGFGGVSMYMSHQISKMKLNYQEVSKDEYPNAVRRAYRHGAWWGLLYGIYVYLITAPFNGFASWFTIGLTLFIIIVSWTSDTQREIGHIVKIH